MNNNENNDMMSVFGPVETTNPVNDPQPVMPQAEASPAPMEQPVMPQAEVAPAPMEQPVMPQVEVTPAPMEQPVMPQVEATPAPMEQPVTPHQEDIPMNEEPLTVDQNVVVNPDLNVKQINLNPSAPAKAEEQPIVKTEVKEAPSEKKKGRNNLIWIILLIAVLAAFILFLPKLFEMLG